MKTWRHKITETSHLNSAAKLSNKPGPPHFILRRRTLLDFINNKPQDRYSAIEGFINVDEFKRFEINLRDLLKSTDMEINKLLSEKDQISMALKSRLSIPQESELDASLCTKSLNSILGDIDMKPITKFTDAGERLRVIDSKLTSFGDMDALLELKALSQRISEFTIFPELLKARDAYADAYKNYAKEKARIRGHFYADVLTNGLAWIQEDSLKMCPLCDNPIIPKKVKDYVEGRLSSNRELLEMEKTIQSLKRTTHEKMIESSSLLNDIADRWEKDVDPKAPEVILQFTKKMSEIVESEKDNSRLNESIIRRNSKLLSAKKLEIELGSMAERLKNKIEKLPNAADYTKLYSVRPCILAFIKHLPEHTELTKKIQHYKSSKAQLEELVEIAERSRKKAVQDLLDKVAAEADTYFRRIHPAEDIGKPELKVKEHGKGSINLTSEFYGRDDDPRGLYSEGHVDSLGLCLFLAIRKLHHRQQPELSLLILDDVLHSVDGSHRIETAALIFKEFHDHQLIITTHDPLWFENLKSCANRHGGGRKFRFYRIADWTLKTGPVFGDHLSDYEWLCSDEGRLSKPADKAIKSGRLLEEILKNLCDGLSLSVPFKIRGDYTLEPLWASFFKAAKKQKQFHASASDFLENIENLRSIRNWIGAHWNDWAAQLSDNESNTFSESVVELRNLVYCDKCGGFIKNIRDLKNVWSCKCETRRYDKTITGPKNGSGD